MEAAKGLPFVQLGPFDLLAWQLLWVSGLFIGQRFQEAKAILPASRLLRLLLLILAIAFLAWRWRSIALGPDPVTRTWLLDKWHLGPLRLINFFLATTVISRFLKYLNGLESALKPFSLIDRHMLPVFCSQICLSVLLIGRTESGLTAEPVTICSGALPTFDGPAVRVVPGMAVNGKGFGASGATGGRPDWAAFAPQFKATSHRQFVQTSRASSGPMHDTVFLYPPIVLRVG